MKTLVRVSEARIQTVEVPGGYSRIWSGPMMIGDLFLHAAKIAAGETSWLPFTLEMVIRDIENESPLEPVAESFAAVVRQRVSGEYGEPCIKCRAGSKLEELEVCHWCV